MVLDLYVNAICAKPRLLAITSLNFYFEIPDYSLRPRLIAPSILELSRPNGTDLTLNLLHASINTPWQASKTLDDDSRSRRVNSTEPGCFAPPSRYHCLHVSISVPKYCPVIASKAFVACPPTQLSLP